MSTAAEEAYRKLLASNPENERLFETIEISHPSMSQTYLYVNDSVDLTVTDPEVTGGVFSKQNISLVNAANNNDLDQLASFSINDLENIADDEMDMIDLGDTTAITITYRAYHSEYLDSPAEGPLVYSVTNTTQTDGAITFEAGAPALNNNRTGRTYNYTDYPMLRGIG